MALADAGAIGYCRAGVIMTPTEYADSVGWLGDDVWHAPGVKPDVPGIAGSAPPTIVQPVPPESPP